MSESGTPERVLSHNELHQQLLEVWHTGSVGFLPHRYRRCPQSGAGNCCCGRDDRSALHREAT
jgi:hypothetical protein